MIVLCIQVWLGKPSDLLTGKFRVNKRSFLGLFSINIGKIPRNERAPGGPFNVFFIILGVSFLIGFGVLALVKYWQAAAKKKFTRKI